MKLEHSPFSGFDRVIRVQTEVLRCRSGTIPQKHIPVLPELRGARPSHDWVWERGEDSNPDHSRYSCTHVVMVLFGYNQWGMCGIICVYASLQWSLSMVLTPVWAATRSWSQLFTMKDWRFSDNDKAWKTLPGSVGVIHSVKSQCTDELQLLIKATAT